MSEVQDELLLALAAILFWLAIVAILGLLLIRAYLYIERRRIQRTR